MLTLARGTTWNFTFKKRASATASLDDLNGYKIWFTIKNQKDAVALDTWALYTADYTVASSMTSYTFVVPVSSSDDFSAGTYVYGFRYKHIATGVELTADGAFQVVNTTTNRNS